MSTVSTEKMMAQIACKAIDDKKGQDIKVIDIHNVSVIADYFVIADAEKETVKDQSQIINNETFRRTITESGSYEVMVTAYDNAGNCTKLSNPVTFVVDGTAPVIQISPENYDQNWAIKKTITFTQSTMVQSMTVLNLFHIL